MSSAQHKQAAYGSSVALRGLRVKLRHACRLLRQCRPWPEHARSLRVAVPSAPGFGKKRVYRGTLITLSPYITLSHEATPFCASPSFPSPSGVGDGSTFGGSGSRQTRGEHPCRP